MSNSRRKWLWVLAAAALLTGCSSQAAGGDVLLVSPDYQGSETTYTTSEADYRSLYTTVDYYGSVEYTRTVTVTCEGFGGMVLKSIDVQKGDTVAKGDVLAHFDVSYSEATLIEMKTNLEILQMQYSSGLDEYSTAVSDAEAALGGAEPDSYNAQACSIALEKARNAYDYYVKTQEDAISDLKSQIEEYEEVCRTDTIVAPESGVITNLATMTESMEIRDSTFLCEIGISGSRRVVLNNKTQDAYRMGETVTVTGKAIGGDLVYEGVVVSSLDVRNSVIPDGVYAFVALPDESCYDELKAKTTTIIITSYVTYYDSLLTVPSDAVIFEETSRYVNVLDDGIIRKRYVTVGSKGIDPVTGEEITQIIDGISQGEVVIVGGR